VNIVHLQSRYRCARSSTRHTIDAAIAALKKIDSSVVVVNDGLFSEPITRG